jgi:predicted nucleic acid-binding protein
VRRILLDTSALSAFFRGHEGIAAAVRSAGRIAVTPIVLGELGAGFRGGNRYDENRKLLRRFLDSPRVRILGIDPETADRYALIHDSLRRAGTPIPTNDIWIAASAMQFGLLLVTTDAHYERVSQIASQVHDVPPA